MNKNITETLLGGGVLIVAIWFVLFGIQSFEEDSLDSDQFELIANFSNSGGLKVGSEVRLAGIKVGSISKITLDPTTYQAIVVMSIFDYLSLPVDSEAIVAQEGLLGGNFVSLTPGGSEDLLVAGEKIEFTQSAISLNNLLMKFSGK